MSAVFVDFICNFSKGKLAQDFFKLSLDNIISRWQLKKASLHTQVTEERFCQEINSSKVLAIENLVIFFLFETEGQGSGFALGWQIIVSKTNTSLKIRKLSILSSY